jgi:serine/threonine protein kinase
MVLTLRCVALRCAVVPAGRGRHVALRLAAALDHLHRRRGVVHRDLSSKCGAAKLWLVPGRSSFVSLASSRPVACITGSLFLSSLAGLQRLRSALVPGLRHATSADERCFPSSFQDAQPSPSFPAARSNVMFDGQMNAFVGDLGLARLAAAGAPVSAGGFTLSHAAPEQVLGEPCTAAADVYSLGVLLAELATGQAVMRRGAWRLPRAPLECSQVIVSCGVVCLLVASVGMARVCTGRGTRACKLLSLTFCNVPFLFSSLRLWLSWWKRVLPPSWSGAPARQKCCSGCRRMLIEANSACVVPLMLTISGSYFGNVALCSNIRF